MKRLFVIVIFVVLIATIASYEIAYAGPTRVGNGDDGGDLESSAPVKSGVLLETREEAVALLKKIGVSNIEGLGQLLPETQKTEIFLVDRNIDLSKTDTSPEAKADLLEEARSIGAVNGKNQPVYARTFPEAHAATRFFPAALLLNRKQLVALHIHEALHRALPQDVRENEQVVSRLTLALTASDTSFDRVKDVATRELAKAARRTEMAENSGHSQGSGSGDERINFERFSTIEYQYRSFFVPEAERAQAPVRSLHSLSSFMYPFDSSVPVGLGVEFTFVILPQRSYLGPVGLSSRVRLAKLKKSDVDLFAALNLNALSDGEIKNTPVGRDTATVGLSVRREEKHFRIENKFYFTAGSEAKQTVAGVELTHKYGGIFGAKVAAVGKFPISVDSEFEWGGMAEVLLANPQETTGAATAQKTGRLRVVSIGPEVAYTSGDLRYSLNGRFIIDSTSGASLDHIGDLMGHGVGQGSVGVSAAWQF